MADRNAKMTIVKGPIDPGKPGKVRYRTAHKDGKPVRIRVLDADSPDFAAQFLSAFRSSVRKARKENKSLANKG
jgi:hypothetical protein